jgi:uncharacterized repeat protein (TIGR01451 family)
MAGKLGLAAKVFLGTTVLAGGGAGTWYATTNGLPSPAELLPAGAAADADSMTDGSAAQSKIADLDAVASAWGEPHASLPAVTGDSSPVARSAAAAPLPSTGSRYAVTQASAEVAEGPDSTTSVAADAPADATPDEAAPTVAEQDESSVTAETANQVVATSTPDLAEAAVASDATEPADAAATASVARGQEPNEESDLQALTNDKSGNPPESANSSADQARKAFQKAASGGGNRYGGTESSRNTVEATEGGKPALINPFGAGTGASNPQPPAANETIEPLPATADNGPGGLTELPPSGEIQPLHPTAPTTRAPERAAMNELRGGRSFSEGGTPAQVDIRPLPPESNRLTGDRIGAPGEGEGAGTPGEKALEGPQKPMLEIQKFAPGEIQVGKPAKFVVRVRNAGDQTAHDVAIQDVVPQGTKLVSTTPDAQNAGGQLLWDLGKLSPGEDRTVEMQLMPTSEGEIGSVATVHFSSQASVKTKCTMPQLAIRMTAPAKVMVGQEQRVKIELRNPGSGDATGVMLLNNVPQNVKHAAGNALEFEIGTLKAGETRELELVLMAEKAGKTVNVLSARADGNLQVQQQVEFEVIAPGLTVDVAGPERRYLERPATYEVRVDNPGTAPAHNVQIVTKLPKGLRFVRANNKGEYDASTHAVYWSLAELPEGEHGVVELVAMPIEAGPQTLEVESRAGEGLSDQTQRQIMIDGLAAIMFEVKDLEDPIEVGGETGYEIRVVNQGTKAATNVQVSISLPPGLQLISAEGETQHSEQAGAIAFEPLGQLAPKADTVFRVRAQGTTAGDQRVMVQVNTDDLAQPIRREESTRVFGDE